MFIEGNKSKLEKALLDVDILHQGYITFIALDPASADFQKVTDLLESLKTASQGAIKNKSEGFIDGAARNIAYCVATVNSLDKQLDGKHADSWKKIFIQILREVSCK